MRRFLLGLTVGLAAGFAAAVLLVGGGGGGGPNPAAVNPPGPNSPLGADPANAHRDRRNRTEPVARGLGATPEASVSPGPRPDGEPPGKTEKNLDALIEEFLVAAQANAWILGREPPDLARMIRDLGGRIPPESVLAILSSGTKTRHLLSAVMTWTSTDVVQALERVANERGGDRNAALRESVGILLGAVTHRKLAVPESVMTRFREHADETLRETYPWMAIEQTPVPVDQLLRMHRGDPSPYVRDRILMALVTAVERGTVPAQLVRTRIFEVVRGVHGLSRRNAIAHLSSIDLGEEGAKMALEILSEPGVHDDLIVPLVRAVVNGRMEVALLDSSPRSDVLSDLARDLAEIAETEPDRIRALRGRFPELLHGLDIRSWGDWFYALGELGMFEHLSEVATNRELGSGLRTYAVEVMMFHPDVWSKLNEVTREILGNVGEPAEFRRDIARTLINVDDQGVPGALSLLRSVVKNDPNSWVREAAEEAIHELEQR